jgi:hypothetical protein
MEWKQTIKNKAGWKNEKVRVRDEKDEDKPKLRQRQTGRRQDRVRPQKQDKDKGQNTATAEDGEMRGGRESCFVHKLLVVRVWRTS